MKTCNGCKYAEWKLTGIGHLHPSGDGKCTYEWKLPPLPQSMSWTGFLGTSPKPYGGQISRKRDLPDHCAYFVRVEN